MALDTEEILRQAEERMRQAEERLAKMRRKVDETRITARSTDNVITAVVNGQGELVSIAFTTAKWRRMAPAELGAALVKTVNQAREDSQAELMRFYGDIMPEQFLPPGAADGPASLREMLDGLLNRGAAS